MDRLTKEQRRKNMQAIKATGSKIETALAKALFVRGHRYRKNDRTVFGKPDLTFKKIKLAIFVDSEFWHGKDWMIRKYDHKSNQNFWHSKIERNIQRDNEVNRTLKEDGWKVLRFWGKQVEKKMDFCVLQVEKAIIQQKGKHK
jgi:DNA mismatch endonuclease Vsr